LALQLVPFPGVVGPDQSPTGSYNIAARLLKHLGYIPIHITYLDLKPNMGVLEHINKITEKIKLAVK
ncbi:FAST kinase domain-containing protein 4, partial [Biomphalaria glabrata]